MSVFKVNPTVVGPKYGYKADQNPFLNSRTGFNLDTDLKRGFQTAVNNNQQRLALEYMSYMIDIIEELFSDPAEQTNAEPEAATAKSRKVTKGNSPQPSDQPAEEKTSE